MTNVERYVALYFMEKGGFNGIEDTNVYHSIVKEAEERNLPLEDFLYSTIGFTRDIYSPKDKFIIRKAIIDGDDSKLLEYSGCQGMDMFTFMGNLNNKPIYTKFNRVKNSEIIISLATYYSTARPLLRTKQGGQVTVRAVLYDLFKNTRRSSIDSSIKALNKEFKKPEVNAFIDNIIPQVVVDKSLTEPFVEWVGNGVLHSPKKMAERTVNNITKLAIMELMYRSISYGFDNRPTWYGFDERKLLELLEIDTNNFLYYIDSALAKGITMNNLAILDGMKYSNCLNLVSEVRCFVFLTSEEDVEVYPIDESVGIPMSLNTFKYLYERNLLETLFIDETSGIPYYIDGVSRTLSSISF